jgi:hypothetical protein
LWLCVENLEISVALKSGTKSRLSYIDGKLRFHLNLDKIQRRSEYRFLVHYREMDVGEASEPEGCSSLDSPTR